MTVTSVYIDMLIIYGSEAALVLNKSTSLKVCMWIVRNQLWRFFKLDKLFWRVLVSSVFSLPFAVAGVKSKSLGWDLLQTKHAKESFTEVGMIEIEKSEFKGH